MILRTSRRAAFTLMEIMLVVVIIAILAGMVIFNQGDFIGFGQEAKVKAEINSIKTFLVMYRAGAGNFPTTAQGLQALSVRPDSEPKPMSWRKVMDAPPKDPWGKEYVYECPGRKHPDGYDIYSSGPDKQPGTSDDIWPD
jgi:general secretion pathway protein G